MNCLVGGGAAAAAAAESDVISVASSSVVSVFRLPDTSRRSCQSCARDFNLFTRRHHCRGCGDLFCERCSAQRLIARDALRQHELISVRVCNRCADLYAAKDGTIAEEQETQPTTTTTNSPRSTGTVSSSKPPLSNTCEKIGRSTWEIIRTLFSRLLAQIALMLQAVEHALASSGETTAQEGETTEAPLKPTPTVTIPTETQTTIDTDADWHNLATRSRAVTHASPEPPSRPSDSDLHPMPHSSSSPALSPTDAPGDLDSLQLSPADRELVRRSRIGLSLVREYHTRATGWRTKHVTRGDGTGSVSVSSAIETTQIDCFSTPPIDDTITVQTKMIHDPFNSRIRRRTWKAIGVLRAHPRDLLRLYLDQDRQCEWNKALVESRVLRRIPGTRTVITHAVSAPAVGGAVSSRDFIDTHDWLAVPRTDADGTAHVDYIYGGVGVEEPIFTHPKTDKFVRGFNGTSGFYFRSMKPFRNAGNNQNKNNNGTAAAATETNDDERWTSFMLLIDTDVRGWIPKSLIETNMPDVMIEYFTNLRREWRARCQRNLPLPPEPDETEQGLAP